MVVIILENLAQFLLWTGLEFCLYVLDCRCKGNNFHFVSLLYCTTKCNLLTISLNLMLLLEMLWCHGAYFKILGLSYKPWSDFMPTIFFHIKIFITQLERRQELKQLINQRQLHMHRVRNEGGDWPYLICQLGQDFEENHT